jgi:hypothetical protein
LNALLQKFESIVDDFEIDLVDVLEQCRCFKEKYESTREEWEDLKSYDTAEKMYRFLVYARHMMLPTVILHMRINKLTRKMLDMQECLFPLMKDLRKDLSIDEEGDMDVERYFKEVRKVLDFMKTRKP